MGAKKRGIAFTLTFEEFNAFWKQPCAYCGYEIFTVGLDRVDNARGYEAGCVVSCCSICNAMKSDLPKDKFIAMCRAIAARNG
jgi:hypothetical protein